MLNTYIYHLLPHTCYGVRYNIMRVITALFAQEPYAFCDVVTWVLLQNMK
jgi:hypothetical protein